MMTSPLKEAVARSLPADSSSLELTLRAAVQSGRAVGIEVTIFNPTLDGDGTIARALTETLVQGLRS